MIDLNNRRKEIIGLIFMSFSLVTILSLFAHDISYNPFGLSHEEKISFFGIVGVWISHIHFITLGYISIIFPIIYFIVGYILFWNKKFKVNSDVLIPRPDTEILVEEVIKFIQINSSFNILDIGTGTGCVLLSVLNERKKCYGIGLDISKKAINIAKHNAKIQQIKNRIKFINSSIDKFYVGKYDLIISNPPYIKSGDIKNLDKDVGFYEPGIALNGGFSLSSAKGLDLAAGFIWQLN